MQQVTPGQVRTANEKSRRLRELIQSGKTLVMPGAYDGFSARLFESLGFPAIQCSSGPVAWTHGRGDGEQITRDQFVAATARIAQSVAVPVNADGERGFGDADTIGETARGLIAIGAAGMNVEDSLPGDKGIHAGLAPLERHAAKLRALVATRKELGSEFFLNARVDALLVMRDDPKAALREAVRRGQAYAEIGGDCIFYTAAVSRDVIAILVKEVPAPVSVLAGPQTPPIAELQEIGVARVSYGYAFAVAAAGAMRRLALEIQQKGTIAGLADAGVTSADLAAMMSR